MEEFDWEGGLPQDTEAEKENKDLAQAPTLDIAPIKKRIQRNPQPKLNPERILGLNGLEKLERTFSDFRFKGEGHELEDLEGIMSRFEHWAHVLYPKLPSMDVMQRISQLAKKREVQVNLKRIRNGMETTFHPRRTDPGDQELDDQPPDQTSNLEQDDYFQKLILEAEAEDAAREATTSQQPITTQNLDLSEQTSSFNQVQDTFSVDKQQSLNRQSSPELNADTISTDLLRKYDSSDSDENDNDEKAASLTNKSATNLQLREEFDSDDENLGSALNPTNVSERKRQFSQSDSDEDDIVKRKRTSKAIDSSDDDEN
uniref:TIMELESS-interacting protein n=1 Tax=Lepeophtheirus salmonis TaxID=72036 RepID=A0A0K2UC97_LEPSM